MMLRPAPTEAQKDAEDATCFTSFEKQGRQPRFRIASQTRLHCFCVLRHLLAMFLLEETDELLHVSFDCDVSVCGEEERERSVWRTFFLPAVVEARSAGVRSGKGCMSLRSKTTQGGSGRERQNQGDLHSIHTHRVHTAQETCMMPTPQACHRPRHMLRLI